MPKKFEMMLSRGPKSSCQILGCEHKLHRLQRHDARESSSSVTFMVPISAANADRIAAHGNRRKQWAELLEIDVDAMPMSLMRLQIQSPMQGALNCAALSNQYVIDLVAVAYAELGPLLTRLP